MTVYAVVVIGYGRAGQSALALLKEHGVEPLLCVERRAPEAGAPAEVRWSTTAAGVLPGFPGEPHSVMLRSAAGQEVVQAKQVLICTGGHEVPREGLGIPGSRPSGIMTAIMAEELLNLGLLPGRRIAIYGRSSRAGRVAERLSQMGYSPVAELDPATTKLVRVEGFPRLQRVWTVTVPQGMIESPVDCDALVISAQLEPAAYVLKGTGVVLDEKTHGPQVDQYGRTSLPGIWAAGTCVAPLLEGECSAALGQAVAQAIVQKVAGVERAVRLLPGQGISWVAPQVADAESGEPVRVWAGTVNGKGVAVTIPEAALAGRDSYVIDSPEVI